MSERRDYVALDWVAGEIQETLTQAMQALQAYIANRDDITKLRFCLTHIHQVHGTLKMVEFFGAALLAEEMELLADALTRGKIHDSHVNDALTVLKCAIDQLPVYLERVKESRHGLPATLMPILNDLRAVRGQSLLSETVLFAPALAVPSPSPGAGKLLVEGKELAEVMHKLRQMYQIALLGLIREQDVRKNVNYLAKVCSRLVKLTAGRAQVALWRVYIAVLEGLLNGSIESSVAIKILLRHGDRQIKHILKYGEAALDRAPPEHLLKNLLYYVACSKANSRYIKQIKNEFTLASALLTDSQLDEQGLASADDTAVQAVIEALTRELAGIRTKLLAAGSSTKELADAIPLLRRVTDTMAILGMGSTLKPIQEIHTELAKRLASQQFVSIDEINELAEKLGEVEAKLQPAVVVEKAPEMGLFNDSEEAQEQLDGAFESVIRECRSGLEQTKEAIIEFVATQWNHNCLTDVPALLTQIQGSLAMVPLASAAAIIESCRRYVEQLLEQGTVPEWQMLDTLADAITSIDYYLERFADDVSDSNDTILEVAAESVAELGYPVSAVKADEQVNDELTDQQAVAPLSESVGQQSSETATTTDVKESPVLAEVIPFQLPKSQDSDTSEREATQTTDQEPSPSPESPAEVVQEVIEDDDFDPEIAEIFIEEAREVLETIDEYLPQWLDNKDDEDASVTVRRAFHTLKGSGRMVNADEIGELAWAVENMLNRVLDGTFKMDEQRFDLIKQTIGHVPKMVSAFESRHRYNLPAIDVLSNRAHALSKEQNPPVEDELPADELRELEATDSVAPQSYESDTQSEDTQSSDAGDEVVEPASTEAQSAAAEQLPEAGQQDLEPDVDSTDLDPELLEIFASETTTHLQILEGFVAHCKQLVGPAELTDELQRALHTLKGSANMAGVDPVATLITPIEYVVKELKASQLKIDEPLIEMLDQAAGFIRLGIDQLRTTPTKPFPGIDAYIDHLMALYKERVAHSGDENQQDVSLALTAQNRFLTDCLDHITEINNRLACWRANGISSQDVDVIDQHINSLIDQAETMNMIGLAEFGQALQAFYRCATTIEELDESFFELADRGSDVLIDMLDQIAGHQNPEFDQQLLTQIQDFDFTACREANSFGDETLQHEAATPDDEYEFSIDDHATGNEEEAAGEDFVQLLSDDETLSSSDDVVEVDVESMPSVIVDAMEVDSSADTTDIEMADAAVDDDDVVEIDLDSVSDSVVGAKPEPEELSMSADVVDIDWGSETTTDEEFAQADVDAEENEQSSESVIASIEQTEPGHTAGDDVITEIMTDLAVAAAGTQERPEFTVQLADDDDDVDSEILEIFLEEADDLLESMDEAIHKWNDDLDGRQYLDDLQRILHTLKGGARLASLTELGNLSHNFETFLINAEAGSTSVDEAFLSEVQHYQDQLIAQVASIKSGDHGAIESEPESKATPEQEDTSSTNTSLDKLEVPASDSVLSSARQRKRAHAEVVPFVASKPGTAQETVQPAPAAADTAAKKGPQEVVKVPAQLLEDLVNLAGETSISRGQAEEQISELVFSLDEMQITVDRLQEQVRRLDMETEQQILYRQEQVESEGLEGFDPLEMDRYSALQQLSRSLLESSSDLIDIKSTLSEKSRDMETLLIQQSRINTELQEGLMRSRMVPFSRMVPRLRRIVRQVSGELNKKVDFKLHNVEGELDRTVLERMVAPLEHMLRNAVDHGLEPAEEREAANKPKNGTISLGLRREGGEIVLTLSDDGRGVNLEAVRSKAIERGLMEADASLSDNEISQFILQSGFSTATSVTQLSGRGVGMDVVHSEIKQLGGSIEIDSTFGQGTSFIIRLPFTVSVNRALMVSVDSDIYAIPLNTIEGIVRVSPFELEAYYQPDAPMFEYAGQPYLLRYMGALLRRGEKPMLEGQTMPLPVVLVRGTDHSVAIQVDHLMGSREIVVKPLGPQFSMVQGLSGATVLGDGSVVVILDLLAMIRADASHLHKDIVQIPEPAERVERAVSVMVVDDSVTVRKVTSRFLERQGMEVLLAKDGVDAMAQLQEIERAPDVMLLDIEMPRMDGFEVASRVRHNSRLKDLPIIMITSRTGEKHRERALSLGVNYYMGKPYQEGELLDTINSLVGATTE